MPNEYEEQQAIRIAHQQSGKQLSHPTRVIQETRALKSPLRFISGRKPPK